jgi:hypothetical protein
MEDVMAADKEGIGKFFELQKKGYNKCMYENFSCGNDAVRAHSIQNSKVLDQLQDKNHVIMPQPKLSSNKEPVIEFTLVGRNNASTFTGLCAEHDAKLFKLADTEPLDVTNKKQLDQLAYRAVMRELHTCLEAGYRFQLAHKENVKTGTTKADEPDAEGAAAVAFWERAWRVFRYRGRFDEAFSKGEAPALEHHIIELTQQTPTIAVSSLFSVAHDKSGDIVGPTLNVVPVEATRTVSIISYPKEQTQAVKEGLPKLFESNANKRAELSKVILQRVENFTLSPKFYNSWSEQKRKQVLDAFTSTLMEANALPDNTDLSLF